MLLEGWREAGGNHVQVDNSQQEMPINSRKSKVLLRFGPKTSDVLQLKLFKLSLLNIDYSQSPNIRRRITRYQII